jgi:hypothetical protein
VWESSKVRKIGMLVPYIGLHGGHARSEGGVCDNGRGWLSLAV